MARLRNKTISDFRPDPNNPNRGTPRGRDMIERSIQTHGMARSVVADKNGVMVAGSGTLEAAAAAGIEKVVEIEVAGDEMVVVKRRDWDIETDETAQDYAIVDNQSTLVGVDWDPATMREHHRPEGFFTDGEWDATKGPKEVVVPDDFPAVDPDEETDHKCPKCAYEWSGSSK